MVNLDNMTRSDWRVVRAETDNWLKSSAWSVMRSLLEREREEGRKSVSARAARGILDPVMASVASRAETVDWIINQFEVFAQDAKDKSED